jgi:flagellar biosynthesis protein FlhA
VPGLPKLPIILVSGGLGTAAYFVQRAKEKERQQISAPAATAVAEEPETPEDMLNMVVIDPMELEIGYNLIPLIDNDASDNLLRRITGIRRQIMAELGLILPVVRIRDNLRLQPTQYRIKIRGQEVAKGELMLDHQLAIPGSEADENMKGIKTTEPAFGLPALWITDAEQGRAELMGYTVVNSLSVLSTHLTELVRGYAPDLLNRQMVQEMLNQLKTRSPASVEGVIPESITLSEFQSILRNLLRERIPIRDLSGILEVVANNSSITRDPNILAEAVRQTMAHTLSSLYRDDTGTLHVFTLAPQLESALRSSLGATDTGVGFQVDASLAQAILNKTGEQMEVIAHLGFMPLLLCPRELRLAFRRLVEQTLPNLIVLAYSEVSPGTKVKAHGMVEMN